MASIIKVDQIQSDSGTVNVSSNLQFSSGFTMSAPTLVTPTTSGIMTLGAGIKFPTTQVSSDDANTLDDYEEGTWTPTATGVTVNSGTMAYTGVYCKIGNLVYFNLNVRNTGGSFNVTADTALFSLPFACIDNTANSMYPAGTMLNVASTAAGGFCQIGPSGNVRTATNFTSVSWLAYTGVYRSA
jgi:hypothetical protein